MEKIAPRVKPKGAVLVIHSWWGLTDSFRSYGSALADAGWLVGLADLFQGATADTEAAARALRARPRRAPMYRTLGDDIVSLRRAAGDATAKIGVVGFSMGGHWAVWLSQRPDYDVGATILYYGARAGDFSRCRADVIAHFAAHDPWVSPQARTRMERAIRKSGCAYRAYDYPGTAHWFAECARPVEFDAEAAAVALDRDLDHLQRVLAD